MAFSFDEDFRKSVFADDPNLAFQTSLTSAGLPRNMAQFFRSRTSDFLNQFQGKLGQELERFGTTTLNPFDFFSGQGANAPFDFRQEFLRFSPRERGEDTSRFNPKTRFIFF